VKCSAASTVILTFISDQTTVFSRLQSDARVLYVFCRTGIFWSVNGGAAAWQDHQMGCKDFTNLRRQRSCASVCLWALGAVYWRWWQPVVRSASVYARIVPFGIWRRLMLSAVRSVLIAPGYTPALSSVSSLRAHHIAIMALIDGAEPCISIILLQNVWMKFVTPVSHTLVHWSGSLSVGSYSVN